MLNDEEKAILRKHIDKILRVYKNFNVRAIYLYGSLLHGRTTSDSDIDLIIILKKNGTEKREVIIGKKEFHHTIVSLNILEKDSINSSKGYLYINKFLGPGIFLYSDRKIKEILSRIFGTFLDNYIIKYMKKKKVSLDNIVAQTYLKHLELFPHYIVPLSKWICSSRVNKLLETTKNKFREALKFSKIAKLIKKDIYLMKINNPENYLTKIKNEILVMRWWKINQINHQNDQEFILNHLDKFYFKAKSSENEITKTLNILKDLANEQKLS